MCGICAIARFPSLETSWRNMPFALAVTGLSEGSIGFGSRAKWRRKQLLNAVSISGVHIKAKLAMDVEDSLVS